MKNEEIEKEMEFLLSVALQKCGTVYDAEDLVQETLLCALSYEAKGKTIKNTRAWLLTVLNHKWNDSLRRKYQQPILGIGEGFDPIDEDTHASNIDNTNEAEQIRKQIAHLAKIYREVIVRHYMNGQSVAAIAAALGIPEGTVKRRLHNGRAQMKKGMMNMEPYSRQSYQPIILNISNSGNNGRNHEPQSLIKNDLLAQNILWAAYEKPITVEELSRTIGTTAPYVESVIQKLLDGELMKRVGDRYYTDFMISTVLDMERLIPEQKQFVKNHFDLLWNAIDNGLETLRKKNFYRRCTFDERNSLELYFAFNCLDYGIYWTFCEIFHAEQNFPYRADGGRWIAFGSVSLKEFNPMEHQDLMSHSYSGERFVRFENFATSKLLELHVYSADGFPNYSYHHSPDYDFLKESDDVDDIITRLLYIVHTGTDPESVGFHTEYLKAIPWLKKCKILRDENGKSHVNIPIVNQEEFGMLCNLLTNTKHAMCEELKDTLAEFFKGKKQKIPAHLDSVPLQKQYLYADNAILFATIREAMKRGKLYDGNYDDDRNGIHQHPCPMLLVIDS